MTGAEHYLEAERLALGVLDIPLSKATIIVALAQVHATLALAAAGGGA